MPVPVAARSKATRLLRSWVRIPLGAWTFVCHECCVLSGRGLCDELITRPEESYRLWCVAVCDLETSWMRRPWPTEGCCTKTNKQTRCRYFIFQHAIIGAYNNITVWENNAPVENLIVAAAADVGHPGCPTCHAPRSTVVRDLWMLLAEVVEAVLEVGFL